ncbi:MAG: hypothetical protein HYY48_06055 [Gammaproteobacteria bacterium]|nr:hypothetical protein [Gammaproteobacteria bacterium]
MRQTLLAFAGLLISSAGFADSTGFDEDSTGVQPAGWTCGVTGRGSPIWTVEADAAAPSGPNVLTQSGDGTFPWCAKTDVAITDGFVEVKIKPMQGSEDRAGGLMWRWTDGDNYYIARANALEDNVSLYYTTRGSRHTIKYVDAPVAADQWHTLRVEFAGKRIQVMLDGKAYIDLEDEHITGAGAVGVWTKADSVTAFDDFSWSGQ